MNKDERFVWDAIFPSISLSGSGTRKFLQGQTTSDVLGVETGEIIRTCWLSLLGKLKALLEVRITNEVAQIVVLSGNAEEFFKGLEEIIFPADKVKIESITNVRRIQMLSLVESWKKSKVIWPVTDDTLPEDLNDYQCANSDQIESWRIRQGFPKYLNEIAREINPFEIGLSDLVDFKKGCYVGQEAMARLSKAKYLKYELRFWKMEFKSQSFSCIDILNSKEIKDENRLIKGYVTSIMQNNKNSFIGLALIRNNALDASHLYLSDTLNQIKIDIPIGYDELDN